MTQKQFIQEFKNYPQDQKSVVIKRLLQIYEEGLQSAQNGQELSLEEKKVLVESMAGAFKMESPPMTKEEDREFIYEHLSEKYK